MTKEQIEHHKDVIKWFLDNPDKGVWEKTSPENTWKLRLTPMFYPTSIYVSNDEYSDLRKAQAEGKSIEFLMYNPEYPKGENWVDYVAIKMKEEVHRYRIKPDPTTFCIGDWVTIDSVNYLYTEAFKAQTQLRKKHRVEDLELWKPSPGEWCIFWSKGQQSYRIARFNYLATGYGREGQYKDMQGNFFTNAAPLEFAMTLKDTHENR